MRKTTLVAIAGLLFTAHVQVTLAEKGDVLREKVTDTTDGGSIWAVRWSYANTIFDSAPIVHSSRTEKGARENLTITTMELCRNQGYRSYRYASFVDVHGEGADPILKAAWEYFGGSEQSDSGSRKTSFKLAYFSNMVPPGYRGCWSRAQLKAREKEEKRLQKERQRKEESAAREAEKAANK